VGGCDNRINELLLECNRRSINLFFSNTPRPPPPSFSADQLGKSYLLCSFPSLPFPFDVRRYDQLSNGLNSNSNAGVSRSHLSSSSNNYSSTTNKSNGNFNTNNNNTNTSHMNGNNDDPSDQVKYCPQHPECILFFRRKKADGAGYYICSSRDTTGCRYYLPADDNTSDNNSNNSFNNNNFNNNSFNNNNNINHGNNSNDLNMNATCYHCKEVGHYANQCPVKGTDLPPFLLY
jgi:hypothetical protein